MFLDEADLDVSNEDPVHRRQHSVRAGLDGVKRTPCSQAQEALTQSHARVSKYKDERKPLPSVSEGASQESPYTLEQMNFVLGAHKCTLCRVTLSGTL